MPSFAAIITPALALGALGVATAAYVSDGAAKDTGTDVADLRVRLDASESDSQALRIELGKADRQIRGLSSDLAALRVLVDTRVAAAPATLEADEAAAPGEESSAAAAMAGGLEGLSEEQITKLADALATDKGQKLLERAARKERERSESERWDRRVDGMVDRFAEKANLTARQSEQMKEISRDSMKQIREVWMSMRSNEVPAEERATLIADNRAKMEDIQVQTSEKMKTILDADQYTMYEDDMDRMRSAWGGGGRRGGGGGRRGDR